MSTDHAGGRVPRLTRPSFVCFAVLLGVVSGCAGTLDDPAAHLDALDGQAGSPDESACPDVPGVLFKSSCATVGCHAATNPAAALDLESPGVFERYAGKAARSGTLPLVDLGWEPRASVLYLKMQDKTMPPSARLEDSEIECVSSWIKREARAR